MNPSMFSIKNFHLIYLFSLSTCLAFAQKRAHVVYAEFGGNALLYSANYDVRFAQSSKGLGLRLGVSPTSDGVLAPVQFNFVTGEKHAIELGAGVLTGFSKSVAYDLIPNASVMYRFQSPKGFNFRIGWTPFLTPKSNDKNAYFESKQLLAWGGLSLGYRF